jgi:predicted Zn-dependent protease
VRRPSFASFDFKDGDSEAGEGTARAGEPFTAPRLLSPFADAASAILHPSSLIRTRAFSAARHRQPDLEKGTLEARQFSALARAKCYMAAPALANLLKLVGTPRDGALLRYSLGTEYLKAGDAASAIVHLREAVARDPGYSAAWKSLGKALADAGELQESLAAYERGIVVAEGRGDKQAVKEMTVFARRIRRQLGGTA